MPTTNLPKLIAVDNDPVVLQAIVQAAQGFEVLRTADPNRGLAWLKTEKDIAAIVTEQILPNANGVALLETARQVQPRARRILLSNYSDLASIIEGLHSGAIQAIVQKPLRGQELQQAIQIALTGNAGIKPSRPVAA